VTNAADYTMVGGKKKKRKKGKKKKKKKGPGDVSILVDETILEEEDPKLSGRGGDLNVIKEEDEPMRDDSHDV
jgi:hypothetical protein